MIFFKQKQQKQKQKKQKQNKKNGNMMFSSNVRKDGISKKIVLKYDL